MGPHEQRQPWLDHALDLAVQEATGQLIIVSPAGDHNWLWFRDGQITGVSAPARRPLLAQRLLAFNVMDQQAVGKALAMARETPGTRLIDTILTEQAAPEAFLRDFLAATMSEQLAQIEEGGVGETTFRTGEARRISPLLVDLRDIIAGAHSGLHQIPTDIADLAVGVHPGVTATPGIEQSFLNACDSHRRPAQLADHLGLTLNETMTLLQQLLKSNAAYLLDPRSVIPPEADTLLPPPFADPVSDSQPAAPEPIDLPPPTGIPAAPPVEPPSDEVTSAPYQPAQIPTSPAAAAHSPVASSAAPEAPAELHQMAAELAPTMPEGADIPEHEEAPQHRISDATVDRQGVTSMLAGLANPAAESPAVAQPAKLATPPPATPTSQQPLTTSQAGTPAMRPDLLSELHSLGQEETKPKPKPPPPPTGPPTPN
jgi:hypothetical protein